MTPIPVTLLTGFLGSGKSTLLGRILRDPRFHDTAVVINEFGEVGIDHDLVTHAPEQMVEMTTGCLCCTVRGDIRHTLLKLYLARLRFEVPQFNRLIVETTGLADPAPVIHTLMSDRALDTRYTLGGVVTTVDSVNGDATLRNHAECVKQVAVADRLVLTKTDLARDPASARDLAALTAALRRLNPGADLLDARSPGFDLRRLFDTALYDPAAKTMDVQQWLRAEAYAEGHADHAGHAGQGDHDGAGHGDHHHDHHHDVNRHGGDIRAYSLVLDEPIGTIAFTVALELLVGNRGADLLRVKGIVHLREHPDRPVVIHGVQHVFHDPVWLDAWPSEDRRTRLVFITRNIAKETIQTFFKAWQSLGDGRATSALGLQRMP